MIQAPPRFIIDAARGPLIEFLIALSRVRPPRTTTVNSWYRSPLANRQEGGSPVSQHLLGLALDLDAADADLPALIRSFEGSGLVVVDFGSYVHVQLLRAGGPHVSLIEDLGLRIA